MKNFKFYIGAFLSIFGLLSFFNTIVLCLPVALIVKIITGHFIFFPLWGVLEVIAAYRALRLTLSDKKDPWGKE